MKLFTKNPSGYRPFQSSLYTRLIKSWCQQNTDHYGQHTNLTDNHGFREIANWKWVTTDGVDLLFLCSVLQPSDPTHASECREEARTRMADRGDVGISDTRTQHTDCVYWLPQSTHSGPTEWLPLPLHWGEWHQGARSRDTTRLNQYTLTVVYISVNIIKMAAVFTSVTSNRHFADLNPIPIDVTLFCLMS